MDRRRFLLRCGKWSAGMILAAVGIHVSRSDERDEGFRFPGFPRVPLDGACLVPEGDVELALAAMVDTVVPGPDTDPDGAPGALEGCAMNLLLDDFYPFRSYGGLIVTLLDQVAKDEHGKKFVECGYDQRLAVLVTTQDVMPVLRLAFRAIRSAFYGGAYNGIGLEYVGYPGPNLGYRHLAEASFRVPVCDELTSEGWMP